MVAAERGQGTGARHTWHALARVALHLAAHGATEAEILRALTRDNERWRCATAFTLRNLVDRALDERAGRCNCLEAGRAEERRADERREDEEEDRFYTVRIPHDILDWWLPALSASEARVLLYICRRTVGFAREREAISLEQFVSGTVLPDGRRVDGGTGCSRAAVARALRALLAAGVILREHRRDRRAGDLAPSYGLNPLRAPGGPQSEDGAPTADSAGETWAHTGGSARHAGSPAGTGSTDAR